MICTVGQALAASQFTVTADQVAVDSNKNAATFSGNVIVVHPFATLTAEKVVIGYGVDITDIKSFDLSGGVELTAAGQTVAATGATIDPESQVVTFTGPVTITNGDESREIPSFSLDLTTGALPALSDK